MSTTDTYVVVFHGTPETAIDPHVEARRNIGHATDSHRIDQVGVERIVAAVDAAFVQIYQRDAQTTMAYLTHESGYTFEEAEGVIVRILDQMIEQLIGLTKSQMCYILAGERSHPWIRYFTILLDKYKIMRGSIVLEDGTYVPAADFIQPSFESMATSL